MKKLLKGIAEFHRSLRPEWRETFARLALGQRPDALLVACSDSRVAPNLFASTDPGDVFVLRNVGNLIPPCGAEGAESEAAALEFAVLNLGVRDIVVCGHSECGAMQAVHGGRTEVEAPGLRAWLRHAEGALGAGRFALDAPGLSPHNALSQRNVLLQMEHLRSHPCVKERLASGALRLHGWWFDIAGASVLAYDAERRLFALVDDSEAGRILARLGENA
jgi:carbonic anhydrase